jgi:hypothetical protein
MPRRAKHPDDLDPEDFESCGCNQCDFCDEYNPPIRRKTRGPKEYREPSPEESDWAADIYERSLERSLGDY